jgi:hypothetical protein
MFYYLFLLSPMFRDRIGRRSRLYHRGTESTGAFL